jgi:Mn2+/Fe2+ NRAMP family transporter
MSKNVSINDKVEQQRQQITEAKKKGRLATLGVYTRFSGPGWLQSAITIGGGSLSNSLYLGVLVGFTCMWVQPLAMIMGVVMMGAIAYVTLSVEEPPFRAINHHVSPLLGWGWLIASMMANVVWSLPQYAVSASALQQNLFPGFFGWGSQTGVFGSIKTGTAVAAVLVLAIALFNVTLYIRGGRAAKAFETIIKVIIGAIVICFFGVIVKLSLSGDSALKWGAVFKGLIPDLSVFTQPAEQMAAEIARVAGEFQGFWNDVVVKSQRDVMIGAAATAVGINMTFLLPYSMLRKGWNKDFRGLAVFDLATGLVLPFTLATGCVVMATAAQFHTVPAPGFLGETNEQGERVQPAGNLVGGFKKLSEKRMVFGMSDEQKEAYKAYKVSLVKDENGEVRATKLPNTKLDGYIAEEMPMADKRMAAMLVKRDAFNLAASLGPLLGSGPAKYIFGLGVVAMTLNAATMLMLINGLCVCEMFGKPAKGRLQLVGSLIPAVGVVGAFFWNEAKMWLAVPTSVFCAVLLPVAYIAFLLLMNQKNFMGENMPKGGSRWVWNILMTLSVIFAGALSCWSLWTRLKYIGLGVFAVFLVALAIMLTVQRRKGEQPSVS